MPWRREPERSGDSRRQPWSPSRTNHDRGDADDFIVMVKSAKAAERVLAGLIRYCEGRLQLVVNRAKSRAAPLKSCAFLGYKLNQRAKLAWTEKARHRFKEKVREPERSGDRLPGGQPREG